MSIKIAQFKDRKVPLADLTFIIVSNDLYKVRWGEFPSCKHVNPDVITEFRYTDSTPLVLAHDYENDEEDESEDDVFEREYMNEDD